MATEPAADHLRSKIAARGLRITKQRMTILQAMEGIRAPVSHTELFERLGPTGMDRITIYRNLVSLAAHGLLVRVQLGDGVWRFDLPTEGAQEDRDHTVHPHLVCDDCGDVSCLEPGEVRVSIRSKLHRIREVQLRGVCGGCATRAHPT